ncbi:MAG: Endonuclease III-like protein 1, variant 2 [Marteilia pararefringens]
MTSRAMANIIEKRLLIKDFSDISTISLKGLIKSVGFANKKAEYIKRVANIILNEYDGNVPDSLKELCSLPGVGNKIALLYLQTALNKCEGIAVDLHVHRIANRLEWTGCKNTKTPEQTRKKLEELIPKEDWNEINNYLVGFGQTICKSKPKCSSCLLQNTCPYRMRIDYNY